MSGVSTWIDSIKSMRSSQDRQTPEIPKSPEDKVKDMLNLPRAAYSKRRNKAIEYAHFAFTHFQGAMFKSLGQHICLQQTLEYKSDCNSVSNRGDLSLIPLKRDSKRNVCW